MRAQLPVKPAELHTPVPLPPVKVGESVKTFALKNRAAAHQANKRILDNAAFDAAVQQEFGKEPESKCMFFEMWCE